MVLVDAGTLMTVWSVVFLSALIPLAGLSGVLAYICLTLQSAAPLLRSRAVAPDAVPARIPARRKYHARNASSRLIHLHS